MTKNAKLIFILAAVAGGALYVMQHRKAAAAAVPTNNVTKDIAPDWWTFAGQWNGSVG